MGIPSAMAREIVRAIVDDFMAGKTDEKLAAITQDEIDVHIIPITEGIENEVVRIITDKSVEAFKKRRSNNEIPWWEE